MVAVRPAGRPPRQHRTSVRAASSAPFIRQYVFHGHMSFTRRDVKSKCDGMREWPRGSTSSGRARRAEQTRRRILDAMPSAAESPSHAVSVDRVAKEAGVARSTIYLVFGSRAGLFDAFGEELMERGGLAGLLGGGPPRRRARAHARRPRRGGADVRRRARRHPRAVPDGPARPRRRRRARSPDEAERSARDGSPRRPTWRSRDGCARTSGRAGGAHALGLSRASTASTCSTPGSGSRWRRRPGCWSRRPSERCCGHDARAPPRGCLALLGATEEWPFGDGSPTAFKVGGKIFAITRLDAAPLAVSLKCEPELALELRASHAEIRPGLPPEQEALEHRRARRRPARRDGGRPHRGLLRPRRRRAPRKRRPIRR